MEEKYRKYYNGKRNPSSFTLPIIFSEEQKELMNHSTLRLTALFIFRVERWRRELYLCALHTTYISYIAPKGKKGSIKSRSSKNGHLEKKGGVKFVQLYGMMTIIIGLKTRERGWDGLGHGSLPLRPPQHNYSSLKSQFQIHILPPTGKTKGHKWRASGFSPYSEELIQNIPKSIFVAREA
jgi:hypothetical protein